jgi:hypothetical protein
MPDLQTSMPVGDDILQMIVRLRDGKEAVEQLKAMYHPEEANNVALDIKTKLALQHQASAQPHQHPKPKPDTLYLLRTLLPRVMTRTATGASLWADSATH